jgi:hypothetical protein
VPKFTVTFERQVIQRDRLTREIEAEDRQEAEHLAGEMAADFDDSCPDDVDSNIAGECCESWDVQTVQPV